MRLWERIFKRNEISKRKLEFDDSEIIYRAISGVTRIYKIEDITRYTEKRKKQYKFYRGKKKLFQYETDAYGDIYELLFLLKERGIFAEELIPSDKNHCLVEPMAIHKILPVSGFLISTIFLIILILSGEAEIWMYAVFGTAMVVTAYYTGDYLCDKTEIEDHISRKEFLKKPRIVEYSQIRGIAEYKSKVGTEYIVINVEGDKPLKIRRHNENAEVLLSRLREEKE